MEAWGAGADWLGLKTDMPVLWTCAPSMHFRVQGKGPGPQAVTDKSRKSSNRSKNKSEKTVGGPAVPPCGVRPNSARIRAPEKRQVALLETGLTTYAAGMCV